MAGTRLPEICLRREDTQYAKHCFSIVVRERRLQWRYLHPTVVRFLRQSYIITLLGPIYVRSSLRARGEAHGHIYKQHLHKNTSWQHVYLSHKEQLLKFLDHCGTLQIGNLDTMGVMRCLCQWGSTLWSALVINP